MIRIVLALSLALGVSFARAHDPGLSTATVDLSSREILVQLVFAPVDLASFRIANLADLAPRTAELRAGATVIPAKAVEARQSGPDNVEYTLRYPRPAGESVTFRTPLFERLPLGHRQALTIRDEAGATVATELLSSAHDSAPLPARIDPRAPAVRANAFLTIGTLVALALVGFAWPRSRVRAVP